MQIFDTHAHYNTDMFDEDREAVLASLPSCGVVGVVNVGASLEDVRDSQALSQAYPYIYAGAGIHPDDVGCMSDEVMDELRKYCGREKTVCVGEIGLDYYWDREPRDVQKEWFTRQMHLAAEVDLPINVHSRDAAQDTFDLIRAEHAGTTGGIIHCYSGSAEMAREYVKMGYHIGVGGVVTFKNAKTLQRVVAETPIEYLVTETDCPYLAPVPFRGKRNYSGYISYVIAAIAGIKEMDEEQTARILLENAKRVYRIQ
ncbi:MAG: TatD family hydrolase [Lachnospiraceae bacterium]|nr:TatD family hydrolase [Lachnospiraceae bacterium]